MKKKYLLKSFIFCVVFILIFVRVSNIMRPKDITQPWDYSIKINGFYNEPKNTLDVISFGSSHTYTSISPMVMWNEIGVPSYVLATSEQPIWITYYYMKEALKYQKPQLMILDVHMIAIYDDYYGTDVMNYSAFNEMKFSKNKIDAITASVPKADRANYFIDILKYHSRWKELENKDFKLSYKENKDKYKGMVYLEESTEYGSYNYPETEKMKSLSERSELYLKKIIELAKDNSVDLLLIKSPNNADEEYLERLNTVENIAKENDINFINYNKLYKEINLDEGKDFYDYTHLNYIGARKLTEHLSKYIKENYNLDNKKNKNDYLGWSMDYVDYEK